MKYLLSLISPVEARGGADTPEQMQAAMEGWNAYNRELLDAGVFVAGDAVQPVDAATTVKYSGEERLITDGPFAETKEQLGGYYVLECADLDEALDWAKRVPLSSDGASVEVRPCMELTQYGLIDAYADAAGSVR